MKALPLILLLTLLLIRIVAGRRAWQARNTMFEQCSNLELPRTSKFEGTCEGLAEDASGGASHSVSHNQSFTFGLILSSPYYRIHTMNSIALSFRARFANLITCFAQRLRCTKLLKNCQNDVGGRLAASSSGFVSELGSTQCVYPIGTDECLRLTTTKSSVTKLNGVLLCVDVLLNERSIDSASAI